jgi:putative flippase GtrA
MTAIPVAVRYLMVGGTCALLHIVNMIVFERLGLHYAPAIVLSFCILLVTGYALHVAFTFRRKPSWSSFLRFAAGMLANFPIAFALTFLFQDLMALGAVAATPLVTVGMVVFNFIATRWALLRRA